MRRGWTGSAGPSAVKLARVPGLARRRTSETAADNSDARKLKLAHIRPRPPLGSSKNTLHLSQPEHRNLPPTAFPLTARALIDTTLNPAAALPTTHTPSHLDMSKRSRSALTLTHRPSATRGHADLGWLKTYHTFVSVSNLPPPAGHLWAPS